MECGFDSTQASQLILLLAEGGLNRWQRLLVVGGASTGSVVALLALQRFVRIESARMTGQRLVAYPAAMRWLAYVLWVGVLGLAGLVAFVGENANPLAGAAVLGGMLLLMVPLHLEAALISIRWDDKNIYTRSPWRKARTIPLADVAACDYSAAAQWYRIRTNSNGIVRLHFLMCNVSDLLDALPCETPPYPPNSPRKEEKPSPSSLGP